MKLSSIRFAPLVLALSLAASLPVRQAGAAEGPVPTEAPVIVEAGIPDEPPASPPEPLGEVVYLDAVVLLVDHEQGAIAVSTMGNDGLRSGRKALRVNLSEVRVVDIQNQPLEFSDVAIGDRVDLYARPSAGSAPETVFDIIDYGRHPE